MDNKYTIENIDYDSDVEPIVNRCHVCYNKKFNGYYNECMCKKFICDNCQSIYPSRIHVVDFMDHTFKLRIHKGQKNCLHKKELMNQEIVRNFDYLISGINYEEKLNPTKLGKKLNDRYYGNIKECYNHIIPDLMNIVLEYFQPIRFDIIEVKYEYWKESGNVSSCYKNF